MKLEARLDRLEAQMKSDFETMMKTFEEQNKFFLKLIQDQKKAFGAYQAHAGEMFRELHGAVVSLDNRVSRLERKVG